MFGLDGFETYLELGRQTIRVLDIFKNKYKDNSYDNNHGLHTIKELGNMAKHVLKQRIEQHEDVAVAIAMKYNMVFRIDTKGNGHDKIIEELGDIMCTGDSVKKHAIENFSFVPFTNILSSY